MTHLIYNTGTVAVTNGSTTVTGTGTAWDLSGVEGGLFSSAGLCIPIAAVVSDTELTLAYQWAGGGATGATYAIQRENSAASDVIDLYDKLNVVLRKLSLAGITPNSSGDLAKMATIAATLGSGDEYIYLHAEIGVDFAFYVWDEVSAFDGPFAVQGDPGSAGLNGTDGVQSSNATVTDIIMISQAAYDALTPDPTTYYIIT